MDEATVRGSAFARLRGRALAWLSKPANLILLFFLIALVVLTLYPLYSLLMETVTIHAGREARAAKEAAGKPNPVLRTLPEYVNGFPGSVSDRDCLRRRGGLYGDAHESEIHQIHFRRLYLPVYHAVLDAGAVLGKLF